MNTAWQGILDFYMPTFSRNRRDAAMTELIGQSPQYGQGGPLGDVPGSGLLGGMSVPEFGARTAAIGGRYGPMGVQMIQENYDRQQATKAAMAREVYANDQSLVRQRDDQTWQQNNTTAGQRLTNQTQVARTAQLAEQARLTLENTRNKDEYTAVSSARDQFQRTTGKMQANMDNYGVVAEAFDELIAAGGDPYLHNNEALDNMLVTLFNQFQKPTESVNDGDVAQIVNASGLTAGMIREIENAFKEGGTGQIRPATRRELIAVVNKQYQTTANRVNQIQSTFSDTMARYNYNSAGAFPERRDIPSIAGGVMSSNAGLLNGDGGGDGNAASGRNPRYGPAYGQGQ